MIPFDCKMLTFDVSFLQQLVNLKLDQGSNLRAFNRTFNRLLWTIKQLFSHRNSVARSRQSTAENSPDRFHLRVPHPHKVLVYLFLLDFYYIFFTGSSKLWSLSWRCGINFLESSPLTPPPFRQGKYFEENAF